MAHRSAQTSQETTEDTLEQTQRRLERTEDELEQTQIRLKQLRTSLEATKRRLEATKRVLDKERRETAWRVFPTRSKTTDIETGHKGADSGGAVFDDARHIIVSTSFDANRCRDVFVTQLSDDAEHGTTTCKKDLVPFDSVNHAPVFDGTKHVYFMEHSYKDGNGHRFGRVDVDTWVFEELPQLLGAKFGATFSGCWHNGAVYAVDADKQLCAFDVAHNTWSRCGVKLPAPHDDVCVRMLSNPHDPTTSLLWRWTVGCMWLTLRRSPFLFSQPHLCHLT